MFSSRKLRDEYDKLEGALRKLGVDPDTIVGNHITGGCAIASSDEFDDCDLDVGGGGSTSSNSKVRNINNISNKSSALASKPPNSLTNNSAHPEADEADLDPDLCTPFNVVAVPAAGSASSATTTSLTALSVEESLQPRTVGRLRHLDILEEVSLYDFSFNFFCFLSQIFRGWRTFICNMYSLSKSNTTR